MMPTPPPTYAFVLRVWLSQITIAPSRGLLNTCLCGVSAADTGSLSSLPQPSEPGVAGPRILPDEERQTGAETLPGVTHEEPTRQDQEALGSPAAWLEGRSEASASPASGPSSLGAWAGHAGAVQDGVEQDSAGPSPLREPTGYSRVGSGEGGVDEVGEVTPTRPVSRVPQAGSSVYRVDSWDNYAGLMDVTPPPRPGGGTRLGPAVSATALGLPVGPGREDMQPKFVLLSDDERAESTPTTDILPTPRPGWALGHSPSPSWDERHSGLPSPEAPAQTSTPEATGETPVPVAWAGKAELGDVAGPDAGSLLWSPGLGSRSGGRVVELGEEEVVVPLSVLEAAQDGLLTAAQALAGDQQPVPLGSNEEPHLVRVAAAVDIFEKVGRFPDFAPSGSGPIARSV